MLSADFSSAVLHGMLRQGFAKPALIKLTKLSAPKLNAILAEKAHLTYRQLDAIEEAAGMTSGELAALYLEPKGGPFTELARELAACRSRPLRRRRQTTKKAS